MPNPIQTICTKWGSDPLCLGSYSHVRVGSSGKDYDILAESVGDRLFFAGEATIRQHPATMHGAFLSGLREAACILRATKTDHIKCTQKNVGPSDELLVDLFSKPDLEYGNFSYIFDPSEKDPKSMGIMRVTIGKPNNPQQEGDVTHLSEKLPLPLYSMLTRAQEQQIQLMAGEDESKLKSLHRHLGLKLMGPCGLGSLGNSLAGRIANARRGRGRYRQPKVV